MILWLFFLPLAVLALNNLSNKSRLQPLLQVPIFCDDNLMNYIQISLDASAALTKNVLLDTGSNDIWVYVHKDQINDWVHNVTENSSSPIEYLVAQGRELFEITYESANVRGIINARDVELGQCVLENARVGTVFREKAGDGVFGHSGIDGLLGLGLKALNYKGNPSPFEEILNSGCIKDFVFSLILPNNEMKEGSLVVGGVNKRFIQDEVKFYPLISEQYWETDLQGVKVAGEDVLDCKKTPCKAIFDSGTTAIGGPRRTIFKLIRKIEEAKEINPNLLPTITFTFGDTDYEISPEDYMLEDISKNNADKNVDDIDDLDDLDDSEKKKIALMAVDLSYKEKIFVIGAIFMKKYVTVYDGTNLEIGIALKNPAWREVDDDLRLVSEIKATNEGKPWNKVYGN